MTSCGLHRYGFKSHFLDIWVSNSVELAESTRLKAPATSNDKLVFLEAFEKLLLFCVEHMSRGFTEELAASFTFEFSGRFEF